MVRKKVNKQNQLINRDIEKEGNQLLDDGDDHVMV